MTLDEAFQEIGVEPGSSLEEIRRTYLRKTRTWNPAADPDGLRRLHAAFGLLQAEIEQNPPAEPIAGLYPGSSAPQGQAARIMIQPGAEKPVIFQWFTLAAGGLFLAVALWFWLSGPPKEISTAPPPSATTAVNKLCTPWPKDLDMKWICRESKVLLDHVAKGECADARTSLGELVEHWGRQQMTMRDVAVQSLLEKEVAHCRNYWDPNS
jgi:hypothetical protein